MPPFDFVPPEMPANTAALRQEVRHFLHTELAGMPAEYRAQTWVGFSPEFSRKLGARGWIGMVWPTQHGGQGRSTLERYIVNEDLLAAGAPVGAHWIADRQSGALLLRYGSAAAIERFLPRMAAGELYFCIGMSEPAAGSDLAAIKTHATRVNGGWCVNGSKLWTTNAHKAHMMIALVRTTHAATDRHAGLSQFIIDLSSPGVTTRAITDQVGQQHFGEIFLSDVFVPDELLLGQEGEGWQQVNAELSLERSGPERYLSSYRLLEELVRAAGPAPSEQLVQLVGNLTAELWTLRQLSLSVAGQLSRGEDATLEAAIVKDLGACFEQSLPPTVQAALSDEITPERLAPLSRVLKYLLNASPAFSLRGGTREILRGIIARRLGLR